MKGELKTDSQMTTIIPVTMDHNHDDNNHTSHYGSQPTMKGELKTDSQMTTIIPVTMDHNHDNNERRTEN